MIDEETKLAILNAQRSEITEHFIYKKLAKSTKDSKNRKILEHISNDELGHYSFWKSYTKRDVNPKKFIIWLYYFVSKIFGLTFGIKLMESSEDVAQKNYNKIAKVIPEVGKLEKEEHEHERKLIAMINEEKLQYVGSVVLGLNDALVELTGAIAGLTFAFQNTRIVGVAGLITGIAASFSMAASEYLSTKTEGGKNPFKASVYTGIAYIFTTLFLIIPYFILKNHFFALGSTLVNAIIIILIFNFYISVAKDYSFKKRFWEMALISLGVAALSFLIGLGVRAVIGVDI
ncbi:MAG: VIT1/CCC1 transporter family protein [Nanoarchaeota archaeon]|nr:VIT1/CCC1 transporter family protein [DPANN group archaeon]MBL7116590.1 VIT1/CCC1 transporter family protein [Nanoarchaeota archaeon]